MANNDNVIEHRLAQLESHLQQENPVLLDTVQSFRRLDQIAYRMGLLDQDQSFATQIPWWPLISILGTFSAGKSTFINDYLGAKLQRSGNQAVDDKFTVICYSKEQTPHALPGVALDSDPRFPFYKISKEIDLVSAGEGNRIDSYLQLKSINSENLKGKIVIDSPGFDADAQRTATLRITDHMIHLSDLVLVFFDARHPEPGAMRDTLQHLVSNTIHRPDAGKFLYILNQIDTTAREDNPEDVIAAWQRAMGECGLTAGRFYTIYSRTASIPIDDTALKKRFEGKRDADLAEIHGRMAQVEIERAYRIVGSLEKLAHEVQSQIVPLLSQAIGSWKKRVLWGDGIILGFLAIIIAYISIKTGQPAEDGTAPGGLWAWITESRTRIAISLGLVLAAVGGIHFVVRNLAARTLAPWLRKEQEKLGAKVNLVNAFAFNTKPWRSIFMTAPAGWGRRARKGLAGVLAATDVFVQQLNDTYTNPSGRSAPAPAPTPSASEEEPALVLTEPAAAESAAVALSESEVVATPETSKTP